MRIWEKIGEPNLLRFLQFLNVHARKESLEFDVS